MINLNLKTTKIREKQLFSGSNKNTYQIFSEPKGCKVLIADEEAEVRNALSVAIRRWAQEEQRNLEVITVKNGKEAVDYVRKKIGKISLFLTILDLRMPGMNGLEAATSISQLCPEMPIIITASHDEIDEELIQKADDFADDNTHMGFVIRSDSSHLLKVALEFEIPKLIIPEEEWTEEKQGLLKKLFNR